MPGRLLWHHDEALIGNLMLYALTGCPDNLDAFFRIDAYTTRAFRVNGSAGPVWSLEADDDGNPPDPGQPHGQLPCPPAPDALP
jgi:hypothetical protein